MTCKNYNYFFVLILSTIINTETHHILKNIFTSIYHQSPYIDKGRFVIFHVISETNIIENIA